jgi:hypothetical protein
MSGLGQPITLLRNAIRQMSDRLAAERDGP